MLGQKIKKFCTLVVVACVEMGKNRSRAKKNRERQENFREPSRDGSSGDAWRPFSQDMRKNHISPA